MEHKESTKTMNELTAWINRRMREQKGDYSHTSLWAFCTSLPKNDGRWLWRTVWLLTSAELLGGCLVGVMYGLALSGVV